MSKPGFQNIEVFQYLIYIFVPRPYIWMDITIFLVKHVPTTHAFVVCVNFIGNYTLMLVEVFLKISVENFKVCIISSWKRPICPNQFTTVNGHRNFISNTRSIKFMWVPITTKWMWLGNRAVCSIYRNQTVIKISTLILVSIFPIAKTNLMCMLEKNLNVMYDDENDRKYCNLHLG